MLKFFDKDYIPSRPGEYIHKRDKIDERNPIFKYSQPSTPIKQEKKEESKKTDDIKKAKL